MKTKTQNLTGAALDWAVAKCEGRSEPEVVNNFAVAWYTWGNTHYSTNWAQGGPIIERGWLDVTPWPNESDEDLQWQCTQHDSTGCVAYGPTPLIAAMRCYVASKLGDEVEIPEALE